MSSDPDIDPSIEEIARNLLEEYGQSENYQDRFIKFYVNMTENNYDQSSVRRLIENIELSEEDRIDEA